MTITPYLGPLRAEAEALMLDTGKAMRSTGGKVYDPNADGGLGATVDATSDLFTSRCKIQARNLMAQDSEVGGRTATAIRLELHLPVDTAPLTTGDLWEITAIHPLSSAVVGQVLRVVGPVGKTLATARRYQIEEYVA